MEAWKLGCLEAGQQQRHGKNLKLPKQTKKEAGKFGSLEAEQQHRHSKNIKTSKANKNNYCFNLTNLQVLYIVVNPVCQVLSYSQYLLFLINHVQKLFLFLNMLITRLILFFFSWKSNAL